MPDHFASEKLPDSPLPLWESVDAMRSIADGWGVWVRG
jgi:hypothetical protein